MVTQDPKVKDNSRQNSAPAQSALQNEATEAQAMSTLVESQAGLLALPKKVIDQQKHELSIEKAKADTLFKAKSAERQEEQDRFNQEVQLAKLAKDGVDVAPEDNAGSDLPRSPRFAVPGALEEAFKNLSEKTTSFNAQDPVFFELNKKLASELTEAIDAWRNEKSLRGTGIIGGTLGSILDILPGGLGTSLFGKTPDAAAQAQFLSKTLYQTSPLFRTEIEQQLGMKRYEAGSGSRVRASGFPRSSSVVSSKDDEDAQIVTLNDIQTGLAANVPEAFGDDGLLKKPFNNMLSAVGLRAQIEDIVSTLDPSDPNYSKAIIELHSESERVSDSMFETAINLLNSGMTEEQLRDFVGKSQSFIQDTYLSDSNTDVKTKALAIEYQQNLALLNEVMSPMFQETKKKAKSLGIKTPATPSQLDNISRLVEASKKTGDAEKILNLVHKRKVTLPSGANQSLVDALNKSNLKSVGPVGQELIKSVGGAQSAISVLSSGDSEKPKKLSDSEKKAMAADLREQLRSLNLLPKNK